MSKIETKLQELQEHKATVQTLAEKVVDASNTATTAANTLRQEFDVKFAELNTKFKELEQAQTTQYVAPTQNLSIGARFVEALKSGKHDLELKSVTTDSLPVQTYTWTQGVETRKRPSILDLLPTSYVNVNALSYIRTAGLDPNNADVVPEGEIKPQSQYSSTQETAVFQTVAHWEEITRQAIAAYPEIENIVNTALYNGLMHKLEDKIINGTGGGTDFDGLMANITNTASGTDVVAKIRYAIATVVTNGGYANGVVMSPVDWATIELLTNDSGTYLFANPSTGSKTRTIWGIDVYEAATLPVNNFIVGDFNGARLFLQNPGVLSLKGMKNDDFIRNKITLLAELSGNLAIARPDYFVKGIV